MRETDAESNSQFEERKRDHIAFALKQENEAVGRSGLDRVQLIHEALPELNFSEISLTANSLGEETRTPFLVSSMTGGHSSSTKINHRLAKACAERGWWMGVGSQRRELHDLTARNEWRSIRKNLPGVVLLGNLGIAQVIQTDIATVEALIENLEAKAMIVHLNGLQECLQVEGTPQFAGGLAKLGELTKRLSVPVIVKETGCGISRTTARRLIEVGVSAIDVSGLGGTHWGRIEGARAPSGSIQEMAARTFADWGIGTVEAVHQVTEACDEFTGRARTEVWASGGVRSGLDAAKLMALGATRVGFAKPILEAAVQSEKDLHNRMELIEYEFKVALFCTGSRGVNELRRGRHVSRKDV